MVITHAINTHFCRDSVEISKTIYWGIPPFCLFHWWTLVRDTASRIAPVIEWPVATEMLAWTKEELTQQHANCEWCPWWCQPWFVFAALKNTVVIVDFNNFSSSSVRNECIFVTSYKLSHKYLLPWIQSILTSDFIWVGFTPHQDKVGCCPSFSFG